MKWTIERILKESPVYPHDGQMAFYSTSCCWWTSFADDLGKLPPIQWLPYSPDGSGVAKGRMMSNPGGHQIPCCPHCRSVLMQAPLVRFIDTAQKKPEHYGRFGIDVFLWSYERNSENCFRRWGDYEIFIAPFGKGGRNE